MNLRVTFYTFPYLSRKVDQNHCLHFEQAVETTVFSSNRQINKIRGSEGEEVDPWQRNGGSDAPNFQGENASENAWPAKTISRG